MIEELREAIQGWRERDGDGLEGEGARGGGLKRRRGKAWERDIVGGPGTCGIWFFHPWISSRHNILPNSYGWTKVGVRKGKPLLTYRLVPPNSSSVAFQIYTKIECTS
jgi:hypothetical protein